MREILKLLFPDSCLVCNSPSNQLCDDCLQGIDPRVRRDEIDGCRFWSGANYGEQFSKIILLAKEKNNFPARDFLANLIVQTFISASIEINTKNSIFIPIPSSKSANRSRGYRHSFLLSRIAEKKIERIGSAKVEVKELLRVNRKVADQSNLNRAARHHNLSGAYSIAYRKKTEDFDLQNQTIFLIDDLVTTGSSIREGLRTLRAARLDGGAGFAPIGVLSAGVSLRAFS